MKNVNQFKVIDRYPGYDKLSNIKKLSISDLLPLEVNWNFDGAAKLIKHSCGIDGLALKDLSGIALIEAPYDLSRNRAYIVNADGSMRVQISKLTKFGEATFYDVIYIKNKLTFLAVVANRDFRIEVRESDGFILDALESR
jgi:hypothetical protein